MERFKNLKMKNKEIEKHKNNLKDMETNDILLANATS